LSDRTPPGQLDVEGCRLAVAIAESDPATFPDVPHRLRVLARAKQIPECNQLAADVIGRRYIK